MTNWEVVNGCYENKPDEWDTYSSEDTVYQRRNIKQIDAPIEADETMKFWEYEERMFTRQEYTTYVISQEAAESVKEFNKQEVLDEYTTQLIEGGVI